MQGHVHNYQRTYPLKINPDTNRPIKTSAETNNYVNPEGEIYISVGSGGIALDKISTEERSVHSITPDLNDKFYFAKLIDDKFGFLNLVLSKDQSSIDGTFYANNPPILHLH